MSSNDVFEAGATPDCIKSLIINDPEALHGFWVEVDKPQNEVMTILGRIGLSAIKRRIVARSSCKMDLLLRRKIPDESSSEVLTATSTSETEVLSPSDLSPTLSSPRSTESDRTSAPSTQPSSPVKNSTALGGKMDKEVNYETWYQKQWFPMGRSREMDFLADGETVHFTEDPETSQWEVTAQWKDGVLTQRRYSEALGVTMFDTRCVLRRRVVLMDGKTMLQAPVVLDDDEPEDSEPIQYFQWKIIDHRNNDALLFCHYLLQRVP